MAAYGVAVPEPRISLLFDFFVLNQHLRRLLTAGLAKAPLRPDEYAVYSLLFEQGPLTATEMSRRLGMPLTTLLDYLREMDRRAHLRSERHPRDGRARQLALTVAGTSAHRETNAHWEVVRKQLEAGLNVESAEVWKALRALDDAALAALAQVEAEAAAG